MSPRPAFPARRRAEEFHSLLAGAGDPRGAGSERYADLLEVVGSLRTAGAAPVVPRPEFSASLRERLMAEADTALVPGAADAVESRLTLAPTAPRRRERRLALVAGTAVFIGASTSMAMASQSALPGDALYPIKRALEDAHTAVSLGDEAKGSTLLASAQARLDEVEALSERDGAGTRAALERTLATFTEQADDAATRILTDYTGPADDAAVEELRAFVRDSLGTLDDLQPLLPAALQDLLRDAARTLAAIDGDASAVCPSCSGGLTTVPDLLLRGAEAVGTVPSQAPTSGSSTPGSTTGARKATAPSATPTPGAPLPQSGDPSSPASPLLPKPSDDGAPTSDGTDSPLTPLTRGLTGLGVTTSDSLGEVGKLVEKLLGATEPTAGSSPSKKASGTPSKDAGLGLTGKD